jgi:hypothetical protein
MRLGCLARAWARGVRRFARTGEENARGLSYAGWRERLVRKVRTAERLFGAQPGVARRVRFELEFEHGIRAREGALSPSSAAGESSFDAEG